MPIKFHIYEPDDWVPTDLALQSFPNSKNKTSLGQYVVSRSPTKAIPVKLSPCFFLSYSTLHTHLQVAVGGQLRRREKHGFGVAVFKIANVHGPPSKYSSGELHGLHPHVPNQGSKLFLHYSLSQDDAQSVEVGQHPTDQSGRQALVWERVKDRQDEDKKLSHSRHFRRFRSSKPLRTLSAMSHLKYTADNLESRILATVTLCSGWEDKDAFKLEFKKSLSTRDYLAATITALNMWVYYCDGKLDMDKH